MDKLLHVSCLVKEAGVYDVLLALTALKVGNVEVRPIAPVQALAPPAPQNGTTEKQRIVLNAIAAGPKRASVIAAETNQSNKAVSQMLFYLMKKKLVKPMGKNTWGLK